MKRLYSVCLLLAISCTVVLAQAKPSVSILGDSYSTFEGYLTPDTMDIWYFEGAQDARRTDVKSVSETWWMQLIKKKNWKLYCVMMHFRNQFFIMAKHFCMISLVNF